MDSFSFADNIKTIFDFSPVSNEISCFHGIKAITLLILIGCHSYLFRGASHDQSSVTYQKYFASGDNFTVDFLASTVDTFFVLSAILFTRSVLRDLEKYVNNSVKFKIIEILWLWFTLFSAGKTLITSAPFWCGISVLRLQSCSFYSSISSRCSLSEASLAAMTSFAITNGGRTSFTSKTCSIKLVWWWV